MAFSTGKGSYFAVDGPDGSLYNLSPYTTNVDHNLNVDTPETTTYGNRAVRRIPGLKAGTVSVSGNFSADPDRRLPLIVGTIVSFQLGPNGNGAGAVRYSGEALVTGYSVSAPVDGVVTFTLDLEADGAVTRDTF